jgi:ELWxxDGT repeat protein
MMNNYLRVLIVMTLSAILNVKAQTPYLVKDLNDDTEIKGGGSISLSLRNNGCKMKLLNDVLIYNSRDEFRGNELWRTDGTDEGTYLLKDINEDGSSYPSQFVAFGDVLVFATRHGELWKTDGTTEGTVFLKAGFGDQFVLDNFKQEFFLDNTLYFGAQMVRQKGPF